MTIRRIRAERHATGIFLGLDRAWVGTSEADAVPRDVVSHPGGVAVLPIAGGEVVFVRQFRVAIDSWVLEIPAGKLDPTDRDPAAAARRELREEIGAEAGDLVELGSTYVSPGYTSERIHLFVAEGILVGERTPHGLEEESAEIVRVPWEEALAMLDRGQIVDAKSQIALALWARRRADT